MDFMKCPLGVDPVKLKEVVLNFYFCMSHSAHWISTLQLVYMTQITRQQFNAARLCCKLHDKPINY